WSRRGRPGSASVRWHSPLYAPCAGSGCAAVRSSHTAAGFHARQIVGRYAGRARQLLLLDPAHSAQVL
ncbi:MAG: hypothetical protein MUC94_18500, partial [bacterium]|nr:hypothetical protein [bacterium]